MTNIVIFGAGGRAGRAAVAESLVRGHSVTAVVRDPRGHTELTADGVRVIGGDVTDAAGVAEVVVGHDVVISAAADLTADPTTFFVSAASALIDGLDKVRVRRLLAVGLSVLLETSPGVRVIDGPDFPAEHKPFCEGHAAGADVLRQSTGDLDWLVISPVGDFDHAGERTGRYRLGATADMSNLISYADFAVAVLDEIDNPRHHRTHLGVRAHS